MGAGILPVVLHNSVLFFLMGKERHNNLWCDFGGSHDQNESIFDTAIREGGEELNGLLGINEKMYNKVKKNLIKEMTTKNNPSYTSFLFKTDYDPNLVNSFTNINIFAETYLPNLIDNEHNGLFEKSEIKWFTVNDLNNNIDNFRWHYRPVVKTIIENEKNIQKSIININKYSH
jgi:8-oxo-dGTP pyrophosphatase MutT (NUDIX family)